MPKVFCLLVVMNCVLDANAQDRIIITDPSIEFSFPLPKGWEIKDDERNVNVYNPNWDYTNLSITYFENPHTVEIDQILQTRLLFSYPDINGFKKVRRGKSTIDKKPAKWVIFKANKEGINYKCIEYIYNKHGQVFYLTVISRQEDFREHKQYFQEVIMEFEANPF